jgi:VWFA-related protein
MVRRPVVVAVGLAILVAVPAAQQQRPRESPQAPPQTRPVFRAGADHVAVDVVVTDTHNQPIIDLTKDDFEITENGKVQSIADFAVISVPVAHRMRAPTSTIHAPEPDVATNAPPSPKSRLFVLVIDDLHILETDVIPVKRVVTEFLQALSPDDQVAVVFVGRSDLSVGVTSDLTRLGTTVDRVREALGFGLDALGHSTASNLAQADVILNYARQADAVLENVARAVAGSGHSRRAIIYVSGASVATLKAPPALHSDYFFRMDIYEAARRADVPIYTLDPRGLVQPEEAVRAGIGAIGGYGLPSGSTVRARIASNIQLQQDRLYEAAENTGGRAFVNRNDLAQAVDEIVADNGSFYVLGYYPEPFAADGKFHPLTVRVKRPDVRVRARAGYVASTASPATSTDVQPMLASAMGQALNVSGVSLRAFAAPLARSAKGMTTVVTVEVSYPETASRLAGLDDDLRLSVLALDPDAKIKATSEHGVHVTAPAPSEGPVTVLVNDVIDLPSQPLTLRIGAASGTLGRAGTVQMPIDVPKPSDGKLQMGGVALGVAGGSAEPAFGSVIHALVPFQPTTGRTFSSADTLRVFTRVFWASKMATALVSLDVAGEATARQDLTVNGARGANGAYEGTVDTTLSLRGFRAGPHSLEIIAHMASGQTATRSIAFEVR